MIKHISIDFWNTIMVSNKKFSSSRLDYFKNKFFTNKTKDEISFYIEKIGEESDQINMSQGVSIPSESMYKNLFAEFGDNICDNQAKEIYDNLEILFLKYPPIPMYDLEELKNILNTLRSMGVSTNISSNTAYIKGETLIKVFQQFDYIDNFDFYIFSDQINSSKPSNIFFKNLESKCKNIGVSKNNIIHIGDSLEADIEGANAYGIKSKLIDPINKDLILFLRNYRN